MNTLLLNAYEVNWSIDTCSTALKDNNDAKIPSKISYRERQHGRLSGRISGQRQSLAAREIRHEDDSGILL